MAEKTSAQEGKNGRKKQYLKSNEVTFAKKKIEIALSQTEPGKMILKEETMRLLFCCSIAERLNFQSCKVIWGKMKKEKVWI